MKQAVNYGERLAHVADVDWARLAAFIDGEGSIYINREKPRKPGYSPRHFLCVSVVGTSVLLMKWLKDTFNGCVYERSGRFNKLGKKQAFAWQVNCAQAEFIVSKCLPFFVVKRQLAEVGLALRELYPKSSRGLSVKVSPLVTQERENLRDRMRQIGKGDLTSSLIN